MLFGKKQLFMEIALFVVIFLIIVPFILVFVGLAFDVPDSVQETM